MPGDPYCSILVMKVASRCNINCTYCYMYSNDKSYLKQPKFMSQETVVQLLQRVKEHCIRHSLKRFFFVFHGGEPLLASKEFYINFVETARVMLNGIVKMYFSLQTNALLLDDEWCELFVKYRIRVGISMDGPQEIHDLHRIDHAGNGTFSRVLKGLEVLKRSELHQYSKLLCVMNVDTDPDALYDFFKSTGMKTIDLLFPDVNYEQPAAADFEKMETRYADWLIRIFDRWVNDSRSDAPLQIRRFNHAVSLLLGKSTMADEMGLEHNSVLVIETDGGIEAIDTMKICGDGFTKANLNVRANTIDEALDSQLAKLYYTSHTNLCSKCDACHVKEVCGGGNISHRYSKANNFDNPSIYCKDLEKLYLHIRETVVQMLSKYELIEG